MLLSSCGSEHTPLGPNQALLVVSMPSMKSTARALDAKGSTIPAEVTEILFEVADATGNKIGEAQDFLKVKSVQFALAADRNYTLTGTAKFGTVTLYQGSETVAALKPGETRDVAVSLLAKIKFALSVTSDVQTPQGSTGDAPPTVQWKLGQTKEIKVDVEGLDDKTIAWSVNDIPGGDATLGTVSPLGTYTPPAVIPANPNIRIKAVPAAAPSFAKNVDVKLISEPGNSELPVSSANPPGGLFTSPQTITLSCTACSAIHYTVDGSEPTTASPPYSGAIGVGVPTELKFFAVNAIGNAEDAHSESYAFIIPPAAPSNLNAIGGDGRIDLAWLPVAGATGYNVYRGTTAGVSTGGAPTGTVTTPSFTSLGLTNGVTYFFRVVATNVAGSGPDSVEVSAKPLPPLPAAPANLLATAGDAQATLTWSAVAGASEYRIYRSTSTGVVTTGTPLTVVTNTQYIDLALINGTTYFYKVVAANLAGPGAASAEASAKPLPPIPTTAPANFTATAGNTQVGLAWTAVVNATEYRVFRGTASGVSIAGNPLTTVATTSFTDQGLTNGTVYYYKVVAANLAGPGPASAEANAKPLPALPAVPVNVAATASNAQVALTWPVANGATGYRVFRSTTTGTATSQPALTDVAVPSYTDLAVTNGITYFYQVEATNLAGASPPSTEVSAKPLPPLPAAPTNLVATASDSQVALSWTAVTGATEYRIYRATTAGVSTSGVPVGTVTTLSFTSMGLTNGTTYYFKVVAANLAGPGAASLEVSAKPLPPLPAAPTNLTATATNTQVALAWVAVANATEYRVFRGTTAGVSTAGSPLATVTTTSFADTGLTNGTTYYYKIVAANIAGPGPASTEVSGKPLPALPAAPTSFTAQAGDTQVILAWAAVTGATEYRVYRGTTAGVVTAGTPLATVTGTTYTNISLTNGTIYYYRVVAANLAGPGPASLEVSAKPLPPLPAAPTNLTATAGNTQITLLWAAVTGATEYRVFRGTVAGVTTTGTPLSVVAASTYTNTGLTNGTKYFYKVVAANLAGPGPSSAEVSAASVPPVPTAPINVTATPDNQRVTVNWSAVIGATEYNVYRGTTPNVPAIGTPFAAAIKVLPLVDNTVVNDTTYYYKVTAANLGGEGPASAEVSARPGVLLSSVVLSDASLPFCFQNAVKLGGYKFVYELTSLNCADYGITTLKGMEQLTGIVTLNLHYNPSVTDLTPLGQLPNLRELDFSLNSLTAAPDLTGWPAIERLVLNNNLITDIDTIGISPTMRDLNLDNNPLESINALTKWVPSKDLTLHLNGTNLVDVAALEVTPKIRSASITGTPYLSCKSVSHLDQVIDGSNGSGIGVVTWSTCVDVLPTKFSFVENGSRHGWRQEGLGETNKFTYVSPNPFSLKWELAPVVATVDGWLTLTRTSAWPALPTNQWFVDFISPDITNEANWQGMTDLSLRAASTQYKGTLQLQFLLDVTRKKDGVMVNLREIDGLGNPIFHTIPSAANLSLLSGSFGAVSTNYIVNNIRLRIFGSTPTGDLVLHLDDITTIVLK